MGRNDCTSEIACELCKSRVHNRCGLTGRPRGYMRQFGLSRVTFREMALAGKIPGCEKSKLVKLLTGCRFK